tara:strand:- start:33 stop:251 length:219 start_codon:yes stop_codon:yes gene_type:complete
MPKKKKTPDGPDALYRMWEVADILCVTPKTCYRWSDEGRLKVVRLGRHVRVPASEVTRILREGIKKETPKCS